MASPVLSPSYLDVHPARTPKLTYRQTLDDASSFTHEFPTQHITSEFFDTVPSPEYSPDDNYTQFEGHENLISSHFFSEIMAKVTQKQSASSSRLTNRLSMIPEEEPVVTVEGLRKQPGFWKLFFSYQEEPTQRGLKVYKKYLAAKHGADARGNLNTAGLGISDAKVPRRIPKPGKPKKASKAKEKLLSRLKRLVFRRSAPSSAPSAGITVNTTTQHLTTPSLPAPTATIGAPNESKRARNMAEEYGWAEPSSSSSKSVSDLLFHFC